MRDDTVGKGINLVGVVIGALAFVGFLIAFVYFVIAKGKAVQSDLDKQTNDAMNYKYEQYEGEVVSGSEVLTAITQFKSDTIYILVDNGLSKNYYNLDDNFAKANGVAFGKDKSDLTNYINPSSKFIGEVNYDNDVIVGITFTKQ